MTDTEAADALLRANARVELEDFSGNVALDLACEGGHATLVRTLLCYRYAPDQICA